MKQFSLFACYKHCTKRNQWKKYGVGVKVFSMDVNMK